MDRLLGTGLIAIGLVLFFYILPAQIVAPTISIGGSAGGLASSPRFFPGVMAALVGLLGIALLVRGHSRKRTLDNGEGFRFNKLEAIRVGGTSVILVVYLAVLDDIGYLLTTPPTVVCLALLLGYRRWIPLGAVAVGITILIYFGFRIGMKLLLPEGPFG